MEVRIIEKLNVHLETLFLPQKTPTAFACTCEVAQNRQCELLERRACRNDSLEERNDASLGSFFLAKLVQATQVVACLEDVIGDFLEERRVRKILSQYLVL